MLETYMRMGKNFMTPNVIKFEQCENRILELSSGFGIDTQPIWGVTEFEWDGLRLESTGNGKCFQNPKEAEKYYSLLKLNYIK